MLLLNPLSCRRVTALSSKQDPKYQGMRDQQWRNDCRWNEECGPEHPRIDFRVHGALINRIEEIQRPQMLNIQTNGVAKPFRLAKAMAAAIASQAATKSPYSAGAANILGSSGETTPGTTKLNPIVRKTMCGATNGSSASIRPIVRSLGQIHGFAAIADATRLVRALSPNRA